MKPFRFLFPRLAVLFILLFVLGACSRPDPVPIQDLADTAYQGSSVVTEKTAESSSRGLILIDPGHGFDDPGCTSYDGSFTEAQITESVARLLQKELISRGWNTELTHDGTHMPDAALLHESAQKMTLQNDININPQEWVCDNNLFSKYERVLWANARSRKQPATLLLSLHVNSIETSAQTVRGFEIDYYKDHPCANAAGDFSEILHDILKDTFNQKVKLFADNKEEAFVVTKYTDMPSVLLEMGYASNAADAALLKSSEFQTQLVQTIADAVDAAYSM